MVLVDCLVFSGTVNKNRNATRVVNGNKYSITI